MGEVEAYKACLDMDALGTEAAVAVSIGPLLLVVAGVSLFLRWQFRAASALPAARMIPDLEVIGGHPPRIACFIYNWWPAMARLSCCSIPFLKRPCEYVGTGIWNAITLTWPYNARYTEPAMTKTGRETVVLMVLAVQLLSFMGLGGIATLIIEDLTSATLTGSTATDNTEDDDDTAAYLAIALAFVNIYVVSLIAAITKAILLVVYKISGQKGGTIAKVISVVCGLFFGMVLISVVGQLTFLSCSDFRANILLPLVMKQPLTLILAPLTFTVMVSFGAGPGVTEMLELYARVDKLQADELQARLKQMGQAPFLRGAPKWDLKQINGVALKDLASEKESEFDGSGEDNGLQVTQAITSKRDWSTGEMKALLKESLYVVGVSGIYNKCDRLREGGLLYEKWDSSQFETSDFTMSREELLGAIKESVAVLEANEYYPWTVAVTDVHALLRKNETDETIMAAQISDSDLRCMLKEVEWVKLTTVSTMWGLVQPDGSFSLSKTITTDNSLSGTITNEEELAATKIQAVVRGKAARKASSEPV